MTVIPELMNLANGSALHGDKLAAKICYDAITEIERLQGRLRRAAEFGLRIASSCHGLECLQAFLDTLDVAIVTKSAAEAEEKQ